MDRLSPNSGQEYLAQHADPVQHTGQQNSTYQEDSIFSAITLDNTIYAASFLQGSVEWALDIAGYIPGVSSITAPVRFGLGLGQIASGVVLVITAFVAKFFTGETYKNEIVRMENFGVDEVFHGLANSVRSFFESIKWVNLLCFAYDSKIDGNYRFLYDLSNADPRITCDWVSHNN